VVARVAADRPGRPQAEGGLKGGTLDIAGLERFPVNWSADTQTDELVALLARG
jgi:hypothetical protein